MLHTEQGKKIIWFIMTYEQQIIAMLKEHGNLTIQEICEKIVTTDNSPHGSKYLSGSISSICLVMKKANILEYGTKTGPRGGKSYQLFSGIGATEPTKTSLP